MKRYVVMSVGALGLVTAMLAACGGEGASTKPPETPATADAPPPSAATTKHEDSAAGSGGRSRRKLVFADDRHGQSIAILLRTDRAGAGDGSE